MGQFRILSLDGGGVRGVVLSTVLEELVECYPNLLEEVDLVTGTSIGGIIALALASKKKSPAGCTEMLMKNAQKIFPQQFTTSYKYPGTWWGPKYSNDGLQSLLQEVFGDIQLKDIPKNVLIPALHIRNTGKGISQTAVFHNLESQTGDASTAKRELARNVAMCTSAAPTFFAEFNGYVDGGVWANNPSLVAISHALLARVPFDDIIVLSIGTGQFNQPPMEKGSHGVFQWIKSARLIDLFMSGNSQHTDRCCAALLEKKVFPPSDLSR